MSAPDTTGLREAVVQSPEVDHRIGYLNSLANSIEPAFPEAAAELRAIADSLAAHPDTAELSGPEAPEQGVGAPPVEQVHSGPESPAERIAVTVRRYAESHAITAKAQGRDDRAWLDLLHILAVIAAHPDPTPEPDAGDVEAMTPPTAATVLQQLRATREADQARRLAALILRWSLLVGAPVSVVALFVAAGCAR